MPKKTGNWNGNKLVYVFSSENLEMRVTVFKDWFKNQFLIFWKTHSSRFTTVTDHSAQINKIYYVSRQENNVILHADYSPMI